MVKKDYTRKTHEYNHRLVIIDFRPVYYCRKCKKIVEESELDR